MPMSKRLSYKEGATPRSVSVSGTVIAEAKVETKMALLAPPSSA